MATCGCICRWPSLSRWSLSWSSAVGGRERRLRRRVRRTAAVRQRALPRPRAAGKPACRREAEAFRPLLARRTARRGNPGGFLSLTPHIAYGDALWMTGQTHAYSSPDGLTWTEHAKADWGERIESVVYFKGQLWMFGGLDYQARQIPERHLVLIRWRGVVEDGQRRLARTRQPHRRRSSTGCGCSAVPTTLPMTGRRTAS